MIRGGRLNVRLLFKNVAFSAYFSSKSTIYRDNKNISDLTRTGRIKEARALFDQMVHKDTVSYNAMMAGYVKQREVSCARKLFDEMPLRDAVSWNLMISGYVSCGGNGFLKEGRCLFDTMPERDCVSWNTMISGYAKNARMDEALVLFNLMPERNVVSWNALVTGFEKNEDYGGAIKTFIDMQGEGEKPDRHTLSSVLSVSGGIVDLYLGMQIHQLITKTVIPNAPINNALITMYARCGEIIVARRIFDEMKLKKEVISWNAIIGGYASNGYAAEALKLFKLMKSFEVQPTCITFTSVLHACAHTGLVEEGRGIFKSMANEYGIEPRVEHYASMVDIVGRHGQLEEAMELIKSMPFQPNKVVWSALLAASRVHNNIDMAQAAAKALIRLEPESSAPYVLLYNMYADFGQWDNAEKVRMMMESCNIKKQGAHSWVDPSSH